ncbi:MAG: hypothetical protein JXA90_09090 [Planctomycetes bacterium]|nr:hypothetical protein [Planctomycetota bacterium]
MRPTKKLEAVAHDTRPSRVRKGHVKALVRFTEAQLLALKKEAARRAMEEGSIRPDMSALIREAVDAWIAKGGKR